MSKLFVPACALALAAVAVGQTNRTMNLLAPPVLGQTATFSLTYPAAAAGNIYVFLWSAPFAGVTPIVLPGFTVYGSARIDPFNFVAPFSGLLGPAGAVVHGVAVPNAPSLVGYAWDLQSIDLDFVSSSLTFADNELQLSLSGNVPANMVPIAPGTFVMGATQQYSFEQPVHPVTITHSFWMSRFEVTQAEYQAVTGSNPSAFVGANRPVEQVSWNDARAYCAALNVREAGAGRLPSGYEYRLPTEAEWEYCCRAGTTTDWNTGTNLGCADANFGFGSACVGQTRAVGSYAANAWGLYDMHGNVWEWCLDSWTFGAANYPSGAVSDPYVATGPDRILRGGTWLNCFASWCRSAYRYGGVPADLGNFVGFRVVLGPVIP